MRHYRIRSAAFGGLRTITVILPEEYSRTRTRYPVLYLHDGSADWTKRGKYSGGASFITVLPEPQDRTAEYKLSRAHLEFVTRELVPWADRTLRTLARADARAVHGVSLGGLTAVWLGLKHPRIFGAAGGQGGAYWYWKQRIVRAVEKSRPVATRFFLTCGALDGNLPDNRDLFAAMRDGGFDCTYREVPGRHSWACWRRSLPPMLEDYFGPSQR